MLVRESGFAIPSESYVSSSSVKIYLRCALSCHWCVRVKCAGANKKGANEASLLVRERRRTQRVVARGATTKRDWKRDYKGQ